MSRAPSEATVRLLEWMALAAGIAFLWWLITFAAAGTGAELPHPVLTTDGGLPSTRDPFADAWRGLNALLVGATLTWLWIRWFDPECPLESFSKAGELVLFTASLVGAIHAIIQGIPGTVAMPFVTLASGLRLVGLWRTRARRS